MTQEDKQLLLIDLCARLPYGVNVKTTGDNEAYTLLSVNTNKNIALIGLNFGDVYATSKIKIDEVKPYLRPMSSMTEKEKVEYYNTMDKETQRNYPNSCDFSESVYYSNTIKTFDWLNKKMFDYRGLIEKGLAIAKHFFELGLRVKGE